MELFELLPDETQQPPVCIQKSALNDQARVVLDEATHLLLRSDDENAHSDCQQADLKRIQKSMHAQQEQLLEQHSFQAALEAAQVLGAIDELFFSNLLSKHLTDTREMVIKLNLDVQADSRALDHDEFDKLISPQIRNSMNDLEKLLESMHMTWRSMLVDDYTKAGALRIEDFDICLQHIEQMRAKTQSKKAERYSAREKALSQPLRLRAAAVKLTAAMQKGRTAVTIIEETHTGVKAFVQVGAAIVWQLEESLSSLASKLPCMQTVYDTVLIIQRLMASKPTHLSYQAVALHALTAQTTLDFYDYSEEADWAAVLHDLAVKVSEQLLVSYHRTVVETIKADLTAASTVILGETENLMACKQFQKVTSTGGAFEKIAECVYKAAHRVEPYHHMLSAQNAMRPLQEAVQTEMTLALGPQKMGFTCKAASILDTIEPLKHAFHQVLISDDVKNLISDSLYRVCKFKVTCQNTPFHEQDDEMLGAIADLDFVIDLLSEMRQWPTDQSILVEKVDPHANLSETSTWFGKKTPKMILGELWDQVEQAVTPAGISATLHCKAMKTTAQQLVSKGELDESVIRGLVSEVLYMRFKPPRKAVSNTSTSADGISDSSPDKKVGNWSLIAHPPSTPPDATSDAGSSPESPLLETTEDEPQADDETTDVAQVDNEILEKTAKLLEALLKHIQRTQEEQSASMRSTLQSTLESMLDEIQDQLRRYQSVDQSKNSLLDECLQFGSHEADTARHANPLRSKALCNPLKSFSGRRLSVSNIKNSLPTNGFFSEKKSTGAPQRSAPRNGIAKHAGNSQSPPQMPPQRPKNYRRRKLRTKSPGKRVLRAPLTPRCPLLTQKLWDPHGEFEEQDGRIVRMLYDKRKYRKLGQSGSRSPSPDRAHHQSTDEEHTCDATRPDIPHNDANADTDDLDDYSEDDFDGESDPSSTDSS